MISVQNVSKSYDSKTVIENISFDINAGEIVGLLGINGAGKSTILKIIAGYLEPCAGQVIIDGLNYTENPNEIRNIIGYLPDTPPLYNEMTTYSYLKYVALLKNVKKNVLQDSLDSVITKVSLDPIIDSKLSTLSHGFRQRVNIAQALINKPKVLILDEPINGLDPIQIIEMRDIILSLKYDHTLILSSHILSEITKTCDQVVIIDDKKIVLEGSEEEVLQSSANNINIKCEVINYNSNLKDKLIALKMVKKVELVTKPSYMELNINLGADIRTDIVTTILSSGSLIQEIHRIRDGLESKFVQLIQNKEQ